MSTAALLIRLWIMPFLPGTPWASVPPFTWLLPTLGLSRPSSAVVPGDMLGFRSFISSLIGPVAPFGQFGGVDDSDGKYRCLPMVRVQCEAARAVHQKVREFRSVPRSPTGVGQGRKVDVIYRPSSCHREDIPPLRALGAIHQRFFMVSLPHVTKAASRPKTNEAPAGT